MGLDKIEIGIAVAAVGIIAGIGWWLLSDDEKVVEKVFTITPEQKVPEPTNHESTYDNIISRQNIYDNNSSLKVGALSLTETDTHFVELPNGTNDENVQYTPRVEFAHEDVELEESMTQPILPTTIIQDLGSIPILEVDLRSSVEIVPTEPVVEHVDLEQIANTTGMAPNGIRIVKG